MLSFTELVGLEAAKQALLLLAVNPALTGAAIAATVGSGKSTLARAFAALLPDDAPFVELPVNVTEDRLLGGLDLEATLATGGRVVERGLLARAHGGVLYVDGLNLLDPAIVARLMDVMGSGVVRLEREGVSATYPARFLLVATYDPGDGEVRRGLLDRLGLILPFAPHGDARARAEVVRRNLAALSADDDEVALLRALIAEARTRLPDVRIADEQVRALVETALALGVQGNRADVFAVQAALAKAALDGRERVDDDDLRLAVRLVLLPRATQMLPPADERRAPDQDEQARQPGDRAGNDETQPADAPPAEQIEALLLEAAQAELPADLLNLPFVPQRRGRSGSRGTTLNNRRGRMVDTVAGSPRGNKIALLPTLLAAAPWQRLRRLEDARAPQRQRTSARVVIRPEDVRIARFRDKAGMLYIFVVDASGSMALNRMREAKGAAIRLLQDTYVHRDHVALIAFRGRAAQVLLEPAQSVERAKRELDVLPTGGGTPLASALLTAWRTAQLARARGLARATLVLMTDGRANVPLAEPPSSDGLRAHIQAELRRLAALIREDGINVVVIDTQAGYLSRGEASTLAAWLGGRYVYLPNARAEQIVRAVA